LVGLDDAVCHWRPQLGIHNVQDNYDRYVVHAPRAHLASFAISALGVVVGAFNASPLYTLKIVLDATGAYPSATATLGSPSLIIRRLLIIT
jgi:K+ transporter